MTWQPTRRKNPADILDEAATLIEKGNWAQTEFEVDAAFYVEEDIEYGLATDPLDALRSHEDLFRDPEAIQFSIDNGLCYCALGAIARCAEGTGRERNPVDLDSYSEEYARVQTAVEAVHESIYGCLPGKLDEEGFAKEDCFYADELSEGVYSWNDDDKRKREEVVGVFREAASNLREKL